MRGNFLVYRPYKIQNVDRNEMKMQNSNLPNFETSISEKLGFGKMKNWHLTTSTKYKIDTSKPEIGLRFGFCDSKNNFRKSKIDFFNSSGILLRDLKI